MIISRYGPAFSGNGRSWYSSWLDGVHHLDLDVEPDVGELALEHLDGLADVRELGGAADQPDLLVDRDAVGLGVGDELLGLLGVVRPQLQLVVVADDAGRNQLRRRLSQAAEQRLDDAFAVDGVVDGLAHPHVVERRLGGLHAQRGGLVVLERDAEVACAVLGAETRGDVGLVVGDHRGADAALAAPLVLGLGERRLLAPVGVVALETQLLAVLPVLDGVGAGADRLADLLLGAGAARHDLDERDAQRQNRIRVTVPTASVVSLTASNFSWSSPNT